MAIFTEGHIANCDEVFQILYGGLFARAAADPFDLDATNQLDRASTYLTRIGCTTYGTMTANMVGYMRSRQVEAARAAARIAAERAASLLQRTAPLRTIRPIRGGAPSGPSRFPGAAGSPEYLRAAIADATARGANPRVLEVLQAQYAAAVRRHTVST